MHGKATYEELERRLRALEQRESHFRLIVDNSTDMISSHDKDGVCLYVSPACQALLGYRPEELTGKNAYDFFHPDDLAGIEAVHRGILETPDVFTIAYRIRHKSGHYIWVESTSKTVHDPETGKISKIVATTRDIGGRKRTEEELRDLNETMDLAQKMAGIGYWSYDKKTGVRRWSRQMYENFGLSPERGSPRTGDLKKIFHPEDWKTYRKVFQAALEGTPYDQVARIRFPSGETRYVQTQGQPKIGDSGRIIGLFGTSWDITERILARQALQQSEEKYRTAFRTSPDSINLNRASDGLYIDINEGFTQIMGYTREEVIGKTSISLNIWENPEDRQRLLEGLKKNGRVENLEARFVDKHGAVHVGLMSARLFRIDNEDVILSVTRDVTERIRVQEKLRQSEQRYRSLVENTLEGYFISEIPTGKFLFLNQRICDLFHYSMEEGLALGIMDVVAPSEHHIVQRRIEKIIAGRRSRFASNTYTLVRKDGSTFRAEVSTSLTTYGGNSVIQGTLRDVTEKERLQAQLQQAQKFEAIGTLSGGIAHDFNNLLMGIQGRASLMAMEPDNLPVHREHLAAIEEYVRSAAHLTRQLLGFSRGGKYEVRAVDINELVANSADMFGRTRKELRIHSKLHPSPLVVEADKQQIEQVLLNIFVNAWQAMPEGGDLYLETAREAIDEENRGAREIASGPYARISITDTGIGMDRATQRRIFDPFFTTKEMSRGTGLGLASAYGIVRNHGGMITVESEPDRGATFHLHLPESGKEAAVDPADETPLVKGSETILLVDDEDVIREVAPAMLERLGYRVVTASGGEQALEAVARQSDRIDLVILDLIMPGMDGGETFDRIRKLRPDLPVILSSGYDLDGQAARVLQRGCSGFLQKPFNISDVSIKIREVLDGAASFR